MVLTIAQERTPLATDDDGTVRVGGTRVTLDTVIHAYNRGASPDEIARSYPSITLADVYAVLAYYLRHRAEVDAYLEERAEEAERIRREIEAAQQLPNIRATLLARRL